MEVLVAVAAAVVLLFIGLVSRWLATVLMWRRYLRPERLALTSFFDRFHWRINAILTGFAIAAMLVPLVASIALYPPDSLRDGIATLFKLVPIRQSEDVWWLFGLLLLGAAWFRKVGTRLDRYKALTAHHLLQHCQKRRLDCHLRSLYGVL